MVGATGKPADIKFNNILSCNPISKQFASVEAIKAFNDYFSDRGYRCFQYAGLHENLRGLYLTPHEVGYKMLESYCKKTGRKIENCVIEYIDDFRFQAYAASYESFFFIGISSAVPALLQTLFHGIFSETNPFEDGPGDIGRDDDNEYIFPDRLMRGQFNKSLLFTEIDAIVTGNIPAEKWKRKMATKMAELAICFCMAHEIGHLVRGHTVIARKRKLFAIQEVVQQPAQKTKKTIGRWLSQAWELQADKTAMALLYSYAVGTLANRKRFMHQLRCSDKLDLYGRILYATYFVFLLLGQQQYSVMSPATHPSSIVRNTYIMAFWNSVITAIDKYPDEIATAVVQRYANFAVDAWGRIGFSDGRYEDVEQNLATEVKDLDRAESLTQYIFRPYQWAFQS